MVIPNLKFSEMGGGRGILVFNSRKGLSGKFGPKFTVQPETCLCITVVSHILRMWRLKNITFANSFAGGNKMDFQSNSNRPLADRRMG